MLQTVCKDESMTADCSLIIFRNSTVRGLWWQGSFVAAMICM